jgi:putative nucleotidyltransferase with HDIG domain
MSIAYGGSALKRESIAHGSRFMKDFGRILLLMDNLAERAAVQPLFDDLPGGWKIHVSETPADALCQMDQVHFDVIFVDLSEGAHASAQLLHEVWARHPKTIRFLLSSSMAPDLMVTCALGPHQFLQKPLDHAAVRGALDRADLVDRLFQQRDVQALVSRIRTFPARPTIYVEVMKQLRSSDASVQTIGELVSRDLAISTKLLQITNSAFFGFSRPVAAPADAVLLLGMETTASLILGIEAFSRLDNVKLQFFSTDQVWKHSQAVANSARAIAEHVTNDSALAQNAYTAGLLHDIGKLALAVNLEEQYRQAHDRARAENLPLWEVEKECFGATHAEAGACLLSLWGISGPVIEAVASHHMPASAIRGEFSAVTAVHLANALEHAASAPSHEPSLESLAADWDYPIESTIPANLEEFREIARKAAHPDKPLAEHFPRRSITPASKVSSAESARFSADTAPNGWWARFRSLLEA